ncbi:MAG: hypothetical protein ACXWQR_15505 [Ktedonobacterales bacterium]
MNEQKPLPYGVAAQAVARCFVSTFGMLAQRRIHLPRKHVGMRLRFADGTSARVYRETVVDGTPKDPRTLVVEFRLWAWAVRGSADAHPLSLGESTQHAAVRGLPWLCVEAVDG